MLIGLISKCVRSRRWGAVMSLHVAVFAPGIKPDNFHRLGLKLSTVFL